MLLLNTFCVNPTRTLPLFYFSVIQSVEDEVDYWKTLAQNKDSNKKEKESASSFCELIEDISEEIQ